MINPRLDASLLCGTEGSNLASSASESPSAVSFAIAGANRTTVARRAELPAKSGVPERAADGQHFSVKGEISLQICCRCSGGRSPTATA